MLYRSADGSEVAALDFRETAPADLTPDFRKIPGIYDFAYLFCTGAGHRVVGVPGNIAGLAAALKRYGTISLARAIEPAATIAEEGFIVSSEEQNFMFLSIPYLRLYEETARVFLHDTVISYPSEFFSPLIENTGETFIFKQPDHARSLRQIAEYGPAAFYQVGIVELKDRPGIADLLVADFARSGTCAVDQPDTCYPGDAARMTPEDLANYRVVWRKPIQTSYRGHDIIGMPPPASGGVFVAEVLNILEGFDMRSFGQSSADHLHYLNEAMKIALADRKAHLGDLDFVDVPVKWLTSPEEAASPPLPGEVDVMDMEGARIDTSVKEELKRRGHRLSGESAEYAVLGLPVLQGVGTDLATGEHTAYSDTRAEHGPAVQSSPSP